MRACRNDTFATGLLKFEQKPGVAVQHTGYVCIVYVILVIETEAKGADGSGISYSAGSTYTFSTSNETLYAEWKDAVAPGDITITGITASASSIAVTWTDPSDTDLDHISVTLTDSEGNSVDSEVNCGVGSVEFSSLEASAFYDISFASVDEAQNVSDTISHLLKTPASGEIEYAFITTADELAAIADNLSGGYLLMNDIDLEGVTWSPIGSGLTSNVVFSGIFLGNMDSPSPLENILILQINIC